MRALAAWVIFIAALMGEGMVMNPIQVEELKLAPGISLVLGNAIEDQQSVVDHLDEAYTNAHQDWWEKLVSMDQEVIRIGRERLAKAAEKRFRGGRVLKMLKGMRDCETGRVA